MGPSEAHTAGELLCCVISCQAGHLNHLNLLQGKTSGLWWAWIEQLRPTHGAGRRNIPFSIQETKYRRLIRGPFGWDGNPQGMSRVIKLCSQTHVLSKPQGPHLDVKAKAKTSVFAHFSSIQLCAICMNTWRCTHRDGHAAPRTVLMLLPRAVPTYVAPAMACVLGLSMVALHCTAPAQNFR